MVSKRFAKANNSNCHDYENSKPTTYVACLPTSISRYIRELQMGNGSNCGQKVIFEEYCAPAGWAWLYRSHQNKLQPKTDEISRSLDEILDAPDDEDMGYAVEVDLELPEHLHDSQSDYS